MLVSILVMLIIVGLLLWGAEQLPISPTIKRIIHVVVVIWVVIWLLQTAGFSIPTLQ